MHNGENPVEGSQKLQHGRDFTLAEFTFVHGDIRFPHQIEHRRQRLRRIQIVRKTSVKLFRCLRNTRSHAFLVASGKSSTLQPIGEIPQPFHRAGRLLQTVERKIELLAVRNTGQRKPQS